jgi:hypothetical protein
MEKPMDSLNAAKTATENLASLKDDFNAVIEKASRKKGKLSRILLTGILESPDNVFTADWFRDRSKDLQTAMDSIASGKLGEAAKQVKRLSDSFDLASNSITLYNSVLAALVDLHEAHKEKEAGFAKRLNATAELLSAAADAPQPEHIRVNRPLKLKQPS